MIIENSKTKRGIAGFFLSLVIVFTFAACNAPKRNQTLSPSLTVPTSQGPIEIKGDAAQAPQVSNTQTQAEMPLPANSQISILAATPSSPAKITVNLQSASVLTVATNSQNVTGAVSHKPPAPPSLSDESDAAAVTRSYYFAGGLALLAAFLFWRAHVKAACIAVAGALAVVPVTKFIGSTWGQVIILISIVAAGSLFAAWHFMQDKTQTPSQ